MDILASTSVAFLAGVAEGRSVVKHYYETHEHDGERVLVPSLVYGTLAMPLTIVGSSPSIEVVLPESKYMVSSGQNIAGVDDNNDIEERTESSSNDQISAEGNGMRKMKLGLSGLGQNESEKAATLSNPAGGLNVTQLREENRRAIAATRTIERENHQQESEEQKTRVVNSKTASVSSIAQNHLRGNGQNHIEGNRPSAQNAQIQQHRGGLPTKFAEIMRRSRVFLIGYSIVSATIAYQEYIKKDSKTSSEEYNQIQNGGRNPSIVQNYMDCDKCVDGVAMRILSNSSELKGLGLASSESKSKLGLLQKVIGVKSIPCSLPIDCSTECGTNISPRSFPFNCESEDTLPIWDLGNKGSEWNELPLNRRMFFSSDDGIRRGIFLESTVSTSIADGLLLTYPRASKFHRAMDAVDINSRKIQHTLQAAGEGGVGITHIVLGTTVDRNRKSTTDIIPSQKVFINSMDAIVFVIRKTVNQILTDGDRMKAEEAAKKALAENNAPQGNFSDTITTVERQEHSSSSNPLLMVVDNVGKTILKGGALIVNTAIQVGDAIDNVGRQIRNGGKIIATKAGNLGNSIINIVIRSPTYRAKINVYSDDEIYFNWLKETLDEKQFHLVWHDMKKIHALETNSSKDADREEIYLILCSEDDNTIHAATSLMSTLPPEEHRKIISIVDSVSASDTLDAFQGGKDNSMGHTHKMESICVSSIHEELYAYAKNLLVAEKMNPESVEEKILQELS